MENYQGNSYKSRQKRKEETTEKKKVQKVVHGVAKTKKKSGLAKFTDIFISDDIDNVKEYIFYDIMIPAAKKFLSDTVDTILFGGSRRSGNTLTDRVSFRDYNKSYRRDAGHRERSSNSRGTFDDVVFETRGDAEAVLMGMDELMDTYKVVSISDFNELAGVDGKFTDSNYGWMNISSAKVVPIRGGGYVIKMPKASLID